MSGSHHPAKLNMLRERAKLLGRALAVLDFLTVAFAWWGSVRWLGSISGPAEALQTPLVSATALIFVVALYGFGAYRSFRASGMVEEATLMGRAVLVGGAGLLGFCWLLRLVPPSRSQLVVFLTLSYVGLSAGRLGLRTALRLARSRGYNLRYFLIVGSGMRAQAIAEELTLQPYWGIRLIGHVLTGQGNGPGAGEDALGTLDDLAEILERRVVDGVFFVVEELSPEALRQALDCCRRLGIQALVDLHPFEDLRGYLQLSELARSPLLIIGQTRLDGHRAAVKRGLDLAAAIALLPLTAPLMLVIALLIKAGTPGPVLFRQERVGMNGRRFTLLKFRSMVADAEQLRPAIAERNEMDGPVFKMRHDPRMTRIGRILRRLSLDELPQLWNVLRGDMSIVGPRPPLPEEVRHYQSWQRRRLSVRPGLTCLWQVSGRNDLSFDRWMKLDLEYIDNWSWWLDLKILARTLPAMVRGQ
jgi:exopolysaccharide biosynthesis polyprenyl glycosylphosphotransferase